MEDYLPIYENCQCDKCGQVKARVVRVYDKDGYDYCYWCKDCITTFIDTATTEDEKEYEVREIRPYKVNLLPENWQDLLMPGLRQIYDT